MARVRWKRNSCTTSAQKPEEKSLLGRRGRGCILKKQEAMYWINVAQIMDTWWVFVNTNFSVVNSSIVLLSGFCIP